MTQTSPIIIFNPEGLTQDQVKLIKQALDDAYRAGYETAKEFYQFKLNTTTTTSPPTQWTIGTYPPYTINNASHGVESGTYPTANQKTCDHSYVTSANRDAGVCGKCGISFDDWHG